MEILREPPKTSAFTSLVDHQSTTPASFHEGPPVLHYHSDRCKLIVLDLQPDSVAVFGPLLENAAANPRSNGTEANGETDRSSQESVVEDVDVWVTSEKLLLFSSSISAGISIPYPAISLHAIQSLPVPAASEEQGVYMQVVSSPEAPSGDDSEPESISITLVPTAAGPSVTSDPQSEQIPVQAMFAAMTNCSNLHPDPVEPGDEQDEGGSRLFRAGLAMPGAEDGGLPPPMPGSGGWITAENMHEFVDEDGNWIEDLEETADQEGDGESLGPGAGAVRSRESGDHVNGASDGEDEQETKWQRRS